MNYEIRPLTQRWFPEATPQNYHTAVATIGNGNGLITITSDLVVEPTVISCVVAADASTAMGVALADGTITITLGTTADVVVTADDLLNTATLVSVEINKIAGFTAVAGGTGEGIPPVTVADIAFADGAWATPCPEAGICLQNGTTYYVCTKASHSKTHTNWNSFTLTQY